MDETPSQTPFANFDSARLSVSGMIALEQFQQQTPMHAYLISGARGLGKTTFAKFLTCTLFCTAANCRPCGECRECTAVWNHQNPDVLYIDPGDGKQIGVEKIRGAIETISQYAFGISYRVVIIEPAEKMTLQAQNCLLKSLEDPPEKVIFLLLAHEPTALLSTIASRCIRVKLSGWPDEQMTATLQELGYGETEVAGILPMASGNIGQALEMLLKTDQTQEIQDFINQVLTLSRDADAVAISTRLKDSKDNAERYLNGLEQAFHQSLLTKTGLLHASALKSLPVAWQKGVSAAPVESLTALIQAVFQTRKLCASQVNWQSTLDHLMIKILEERKKWQQ